MLGGDWRTFCPPQILSLCPDSGNAEGLLRGKTQNLTLLDSRGKTLMNNCFFIIGSNTTEEGEFLHRGFDHNTHQRGGWLLTGGKMNHGLLRGVIFLFACLVRGDAGRCWRQWAMLITEVSYFRTRNGLDKWIPIRK